MTVARSQSGGAQGGGEPAGNADTTDGAVVTKYPLSVMRFYHSASLVPPAMGPACIAGPAQGRTPGRTSRAPGGAGLLCNRYSGWGGTGLAGWLSAARIPSIAGAALDAGTDGEIYIVLGISPTAPGMPYGGDTARNSRRTAITGWGRPRRGRRAPRRFRFGPAAGLRFGPPPPAPALRRLRNVLSGNAAPVRRFRSSR